MLDDWDKSATIGFKAEGESIAVLGINGGQLGQSLWLSELHGSSAGPPPPVDLEGERKLGELVRQLIREGVVTAVHDISDGGLLVAIAEMSLATGMGATLDGLNGPAIGFGEDQGRYVITVRDLRDLRDRRVQFMPMGETGGSDLVVNGRPIPLTDLRASHEGFFPKLMGADGALA